MTRKSAWAPVALAAAVVAVIVAVTVAVGAGRSDAPSQPRVLHLAADTGQPMAAGAPASAGGRVTPGGSSYVLDGPLPTGQPADQPVWRIASGSADSATQIARALGLDGTPTHVDGGWVLRAPHDLRLVVRQDGSWSYGLDCFVDRPVSDEKPDVMCASAAGVAIAPSPDVPAPDAANATAAPRPPAPSDEPRDPPLRLRLPMPIVRPGPTAADARALADPILRALGAADARVTVTEGTPATTVQASYDVGGATTVGLTTTLSFTSDDRLATGDGWLTDVTGGDSYPVITAQRAFELLQQQPRPMLEMCMRRPDGKPGCAEIPPTVITGATLGLAMAQDAGRPTLVPAWLFTVKGQDDPLSQLAVVPAYLAPPATATDTPATAQPDDGGAPGSSGPGGSSPGYPGPPDTKPVVTPAGASPA
jgi:hypothetical protein